MLKQLLVALLSLFVFAAPAFAEEPAFAVGQVWSLKDSAHPNARVLIGRIEGDTIHIRVSGIDAPNLPNFRSESFGIAHAAITKGALDESARAVASEDAPIPDSFEDSVDAWRKAKGEVFSATVPDIIEASALSPVD